MNLLFASVLIALSLTACGISPSKDDSPASDLDALAMGVKQNLPKRTLESGKAYCVEDARTEDDRDNCALDLEDLVYLQQRDATRTIDFVMKGVERLKLSRNPCSRWEKIIRAARCKP